ncbi:hypothetical protein GWI33_011731 [Rhynchophorus ferrugineus]|uniref:Uncharacterized protein n=1 Tax=Rhynchophorus ferrugineus TaxID=354439 RepID=A0A834MN68_RHYFE|nr:hypothetical protein GWI33_011731 [Rhynchophorus ferrugineus]
MNLLSFNLALIPCLNIIRRPETSNDQLVIFLNADLIVLRSERASNRETKSNGSKNGKFHNYINIIFYVVRYEFIHDLRTGYFPGRQCVSPTMESRFGAAAKSTRSTVRLTIQWFGSVGV